MIALTGFAGAQSIGGAIPAENVETVEYKMERNEYTLTNAGMTGRYTIYKSFDEKIKSLPAGYGYTTFYIRGYDKKVLAIAIRGSIQKDRTAKHVEIYIMRNNQVYCVGDIDYLDTGLRKRNGVMCGTARRNNGEIEFMETYLLSPDEQYLIIRDSKLEEWTGDRWRYSGYVNNLGTNANYPLFRSYNFNEIPQPETGWDFDRYEPVKFTIK